MINALICAYKSGDVLPLTLRQLVDAKVISRILVADGPHLGPIKPGLKVDHPSVHKVVMRLASKKIVYQHTDDCPTRADKNNRILKHVSRDCEWVLCVDSDEVYHEGALARLGKFLKTARKDRYKIHTINPFQDFDHCFKIPDWKPRLYRWFAGAQCPPGHDRMHQCVNHPRQKRCRGDHYGTAKLPPAVCEIWHLNALRRRRSRARLRKDGMVIWGGGGMAWTSKLYPLDISKAPASIRALGRSTLQ